MDIESTTLLESSKNLGMQLSYVNCCHAHAASWTWQWIMILVHAFESWEFNEVSTF
jgi:hypothetical protein